MYQSAIGDRTVTDSHALVRRQRSIVAKDVEGKVRKLWIIDETRERNAANFAGCACDQ
jgi:hypothetical protein